MLERQFRATIPETIPIHYTAYKNVHFQWYLSKNACTFFVTSSHLFQIIFLCQNWGHQRSSRAKFSRISELHDMASYYAHYLLLPPCMYLKTNFRTLFKRTLTNKQKTLAETQSSRTAQGGCGYLFKYMEVYASVCAVELFNFFTHPSCSCCDLR